MTLHVITVLRREATFEPWPVNRGPPCPENEKDQVHGPVFQYIGKAPG